MSMMKKFNNLFVSEEDFEDEEIVENTPEVQEEPRKRVSKEKPVSSKQPVNPILNRGNNVVLTEPLVFDDIKKNKVVIINLAKLDIETADRLLDFISGGIYALDARLKTIGEDIYLCVPNGVEVSGDFYEGEY